MLKSPTRRARIIPSHATLSPGARRDRGETGDRAAGRALGHDPKYGIHVGKRIRRAVFVDCGRGDDQRRDVVRSPGREGGIDQVLDGTGWDI